MQQITAQVIQVIDHVRGQIKALAGHPNLKKLSAGNQTEAKVNIDLAYRHLEDAQLRLANLVQQKGSNGLYSSV